MEPVLSMIDFGQQIAEEMKKLRDENQQLRAFFWMNHGCDIGILYGDDGELQCGACLLDFKRDDIDHLFNRVRESKTGNL